MLAETLRSTRGQVIHEWFDSNFLVLSWAYSILDLVHVGSSKSRGVAVYLSLSILSNHIGTWNISHKMSGASSFDSRSSKIQMYGRRSGSTRRASVLITQFPLIMRKVPVRLGVRSTIGISSFFWFLSVGDN
jgi:hypothetical protein